MSRARRWLYSGLLAAVGTVVGLALVEIGLRAAGYEPWYARAQLRNPPILARDPVLGWRARPGLWWFGPYGKEQRWVSARIWPDGSRATSPAQAVGRPEIMLLGCSFTMGWAIADEETWGWGLQQLETELRVTNRAVGGYGTYHSLLLLEERLRAGDRPAAVLYGYFYGHDERNVANPNNLLGIAMYSLEGMARTPFCTKGPSGELVRHPPEEWPALPLRERLALVPLLERAYVTLRAGHRTEQAFDVTNLLVAEMAELCRQHGIPFAMVMLLAPAEKFRVAQLEFMRQHDIPVIECDPTNAAELKGTVHIVPDDGHPDAAVHAWWARCVAQEIDRIGLVRHADGSS
jgi:hypothetical protein